MYHGCIVLALDLFFDSSNIYFETGQTFYKISVYIISLSIGITVQKANRKWTPFRVC
jgi:hypothetical protein